MQKKKKKKKKGLRVIISVLIRDAHEFDLLTHLNTEFFFTKSGHTDVKFIKNKSMIKACKFFKSKL